MSISALSESPNDLINNVASETVRKPQKTYGNLQVRKGGLPPLERRTARLVGYYLNGYH